MARSLGLTAYRALSGRKDAAGDSPSAPRPVGELLWIHAGEAGNLIAVHDLAARLCAARSGLCVLITLPQTDTTTKPPAPAEHIILTQTAPGEHPDVVTAFMDHWQPDMCLWVWGGLRPNLVLEAHERGCPMVLLDADHKGFDGRRDRWLPDLTKELLRKFQHILARSAAAQRRLTQLGVDRDRINVTSALQAGGQALPCADSDLTDMSEALGARPVWFAAKLQPQEIATVLQAHRSASRLSHRLLLILNPADATTVPQIMDQARAANFDVIHWDEGETPDETTQIMVVEDSRDRGLFFRVAPVSFLGSSLAPSETACDPFEAAALGSAILYGPKVRTYLPSYTRLAAAGAARIVNDAAALGTAVSRLIAPDQAATMAHAGWDVISDGAELTDRITDMVQDLLDQRFGTPTGAAP